MLIQTQRHHVENCKAANKARLHKNLRSVYSVLQDDWLHIKEVLALLAGQDIKLSSTSMQNYISNNKFAEIGLEVEFKGCNYLRLKQS